MKKRKHPLQAKLTRIGRETIVQLRREVAELQEDLRTTKRLNLKIHLRNKELEAQHRFIWRTKEGRVVRPREMEDEHLRNTISYLQRTLVFQFGTTRWMARCEETTRALYEMLKEARRREIQV